MSVELYFHFTCLRGAHRDNFTLLASSSVFSEVCIAEEVDGVGEKVSGDTTVVDIQTLLEAFLNMSLRYACYSDETFFL
jgi:hypothetical protein